MKKLYLLENTSPPSWDQYRGAVVVAENEEEARNIHPDDSTNDSWKTEGSYVWCRVDQVKVTYLGVADPVHPKGVVLAHFNAG